MADRARVGTSMHTPNENFSYFGSTGTQKLHPQHQVYQANNCKPGVLEAYFNIAIVGLLLSIWKRLVKFHFALHICILCNSIPNGLSAQSGDNAASPPNVQLPISRDVGQELAVNLPTCDVASHHPKEMLWTNTKAQSMVVPDTFEEAPPNVCGP